MKKTTWSSVRKNSEGNWEVLWAPSLSHALMHGSTILGVIPKDDPDFFTIYEAWTSRKDAIEGFASGDMNGDIPSFGFVNKYTLMATADLLPF